MAFRFAARTVIELGKELISSDEVAIYELIKNAVDAGSPRVEIAVNVCLKNSDYRTAITNICDQGENPADVLDSISTALIDRTSRDSLTLIERLKLTKSPAAFLAALRSLYDELNYIEIRDTGHGMDVEELSDVFLRIGTNSRHEQNLRGARHLGDKGIGRLSTMRLGDRLQVKTARSHCTRWNLLDIDWRRFSHDDDLDVEDIDIEPTLGDEKADGQASGTMIRVSALQSNWDEVHFTDLLQGKIARMVDPFEQGLGSRLIVARFNGTRVTVPSVPPPLLRAAHAVCHVDFTIANGVPQLVGEIDYRHRQRKRNLSAQGPEINSMIQRSIKRRAKRGHAAFKLVPVDLSALGSLGNFRCDVYWYNRKIVNAVDGLTAGAIETRQRIANWSGGPMLYRYGFRILPYGNPTMIGWRLMNWRSDREGSS